MSTSSPVTSPVSSGCGAGSPALLASSRTCAPMLNPPLASSTRAGSRNRSTNRSGWVRLSSTYPDTRVVASSGGSGWPATSTTSAFATLCATIPAHPSSSASGSSSSIPARSRIGSSMPFSSAVARQAAGSPYSSHASRGSVSPACTRCVRRAASPPEVGFCRGVSPLISSMVTWHSARIGTPEVLNRVYFACTWDRYAGKPVSPPQWNTTHGGEDRCCWRVSLVGTQQANSRSTAVTTLVSWVSLASKNISTVSLLGCGPWYSGGPALLAPLALCRFQTAALVRLSSLGLNWNSIRPHGGPGVSP